MKRGYSSKGSGGPVDGGADSTSKRKSSRVTGSTPLSPLVSRGGREISLLGPKDPRTPLPGNIGVDMALDPPEPLPELSLDFLNPSYEDPDVITQELAIERQSRILDQAMFNTSSLTYSASIEELDVETRVFKSQDVFDVKAHLCPDLLLADFKELFPGKSLGSKVTVLTISRKTHDKSLLEGKDGQDLMDQFISLATSMVNKLQDNGFWADFIDPFSGRTLQDMFNHATFFETEGRYRRLGFEIEQFGSCRLLHHHKWGSRPYVGSVFTTAPVFSQEVTDLVNAVNPLK